MFVLINVVTECSMGVIGVIGVRPLIRLIADQMSNWINDHDPCLEDNR